MKRGGLQNQSVTLERGKFSSVSTRKILPTFCVGVNSESAVISSQDPVVAPAGIGLRGGSTQRPLLGVANPGIDQLEGLNRRQSLERGI